VEQNDTIYIYSDDNNTGTFLLSNELLVSKDNKLINKESFEPKNIDLPYTVLYKTKSEDSITQLSNKEIEFILDLGSNQDEEIDIKTLFAKYIENLEIKTKKTIKRLEYLDTLLPEQIDKNNPISLFDISDIGKLKSIADTLRSGNSNWDWDRKYGSEVLQTLGYYIKFLEDMSDDIPTKHKTKNTDTEELSDEFISFIKKISPNTSKINLNKVNENIVFNIGQPNTGKSYKFEESQIFKKEDLNKYKYKYLKIPVSGGIGNEYKGLQNTDLAITYDPIKKELKFGEFLQTLMSAIVNPSVPHVVFLDDFHNQDISSLLSEYTPLFKAQQKSKINEPTISTIYNTTFTSVDSFIKEWNDFIEKDCKDIPMVPLTNRISGHSLNLVYPDNFYLLGAANFNENTLNIFADWEDRATINYIDPIESFKYKETEEYKYETQNEKDFLDCCITLNITLQKILKKKNIFDYEKYCFGLWKVVYIEDGKTKLVNKIDKQREIVDFLLSMIKNALKFNNKNSEINTIGWKLITDLQSDTSGAGKWFKANVITELLNYDDIKYEILHEHNIYEDEI
ncbi:MAG: hypothetical protein U9Q83_07380, partial [Bacteroidota bacterium]|nr:hypothetical protein [Bacteroidota bacterium]